MAFFANLFDALSTPKLTDPVRGTAQLVSASMPPHKGGGGMCEMNLVITVPGQPSVAVRKASIVRLSRWPMPGSMLPVMAERTDPRRYVILWDEVPSGLARGKQAAEQVAARINAGGAPIGATGGGWAMAPGMTVNGRPADAATIAALEAMIGMDLNRDGQLGGAPAEPGASGDTVEKRLQRLRSLRDDGLISEEEYQTQKAKILSAL